MMAGLRGAALGVALLAAGVWGLAQATDGFRAFTTQTARAAEVAAQPRPVPDAPLQDQSGAAWRFADSAGQWLVVDFMYTRCTTLCSVMGSKFAQLQQQLDAPIAAGRVKLISISFDPAHDAPPDLAGYLARFGRRSAAWIAVRPTSGQGLGDFKRTFGITTVADGFGGWEHNDGFGIVDPAGRLVAIAGAEASAEAVAATVLRRMERPSS